VPVQVIVDGVPFRGGSEFRPEALRWAQHQGRRINTYQVNPADFETLYSSLLERFDQVISVHKASKLSGTDATAQRNAKRFRDRDLHHKLRALEVSVSGYTLVVDPK
jgi:fatty acid-binding protein DegV